MLLSAILPWSLVLPCLEPALPYMCHQATAAMMNRTATLSILADMVVPFFCRCRILMIKCGFSEQGHVGLVLSEEIFMCGDRRGTKIDVPLKHS